jgi:hypothetical protein
MLGAALCLLVASAPPTPPAPRLPPSPEGALALHGPAVLAVHAPRGATGGSGPPSAGFLVSSSGIAVAVVASEEDVVVELSSGERRRARVVARDEDGLALLEIVRLEKDGLFPSLGVAPTAVVPGARDWLLGIDVVDGRFLPTVGGLRRIDERGRWRLDLPAGAGAPVLRGGSVVGVVVQRAGVTASVAVSAARITALVKKLPRG